MGPVSINGTMESLIANKQLSDDWLKVLLRGLVRLRRLPPCVKNNPKVSWGGKYSLQGNLGLGLCIGWTMLDDENKTFPFVDWGGSSRSAILRDVHA